MPEMFDRALIREFLDTLQELRDAAEFEHLMGGRHADGWERLRDLSGTLTVENAIDPYYEGSALVALKGRLALEQLKQRHPEVWERVMLTGAVDA